MGIINNKVLHFLVGVIILLLSCSKKEMDENKLCNEFYQLNTENSFEEFFDVSIGSGRVKSVYDESVNQYDLLFNSISIFDTATKSYVTIPIFKREASLTEKDSVFKEIKFEGFLMQKLNVPSEELFEAYVKYVNNIYTKYDEIKTPKWFNYRDVVVEGNPSLGKFITFKLNQKVKIYYLEEPTSLNEYWSKYFDELNKINEKWYCEIIQERR